MGKTAPKSDILRLSDFDREVLFMAEKDGDRVVKSLDELVNACFTDDEVQDLVRRQGIFRQQMRMLQVKLWQWFRDHRGDVKDAYFSVGPDSQMFLVVQAKPEFDPKLEEELTALTIEVANDPVFSMARLDVQAMPECGEDDIRSFIPWAK